MYRALQLDLQRQVALKIMSFAVMGDAESRARFLREAQVTAALRHPHIVEVFACGFCGDALYMVMELVQGITLAQLIESEKRLTPQQAVPIFVQVLEALAYAHQQGVVHRDIKPSNVMLVGKQRSVKLLDFGLAKVLEQVWGETANLTQPHKFPGTVLYMSPEQVTGSSVDARSDIYSMGCLMYHTLVGHPPFSADTAFGVISKHLQRTIPPSEFLKNSIGGIVLSALEKKSVDRPQSAEELRDYLVNPQLFKPKRRRAVYAWWPWHRNLAIAAMIAACVPLSFAVQKFSHPTEWKVKSSSTERSPIDRFRGLFDPSWDLMAQQMNHALDTHDYATARRLAVQLGKHYEEVHDLKKMIVLLRPIVKAEPDPEADWDANYLDVLDSLADAYEQTPGDTALAQSFYLRQRACNYARRVEHIRPNDYYRALTELACSYWLYNRPADALKLLPPSLDDVPKDVQPGTRREVQIVRALALAKLWRQAINPRERAIYRTEALQCLQAAAKLPHDATDQLQSCVRDDLAELYDRDKSDPEAHAKAALYRKEAQELRRLPAD